MDRDALLAELTGALGRLRVCHWHAGQATTANWQVVATPRITAPQAEQFDLTFRARCRQPELQRGLCLRLSPPAAEGSAHAPLPIAWPTDAKGGTWFPCLPYGEYDADCPRVLTAVATLALAANFDDNDSRPPPRMAYTFPIEPDGGGVRVTVACDSFGRPTATLGSTCSRCPPLTRVTVEIGNPGRPPLRWTAELADRRSVARLLLPPDAVTVDFMHPEQAPPVQVRLRRLEAADGWNLDMAGEGQP